MPKCTNCSHIIENNITTFIECCNRAKYKVQTTERGGTYSRTKKFDVCEDHLTPDMEILATYLYTEVTVVSIVPVALEKLKIDCVFETKKEQ